MQESKGIMGDSRPSVSHAADLSLLFPLILDNSLLWALLLEHKTRSSHVTGIHQYN
jgi:hypothetical protein